MTLTAEPIPIAESVAQQSLRDIGEYSVAGGVLVYQQAVGRPSQLMWVDRRGRDRVAVGEPAPYVSGHLSADASVAALVLREETGEQSAWTMDVKRGTATRSGSYSAAGRTTERF